MASLTSVRCAAVSASLSPSLPKAHLPVRMRPRPQSVGVAARSSRAGSGTTSRCGRGGSPPKSGVIYPSSGTAFGTSCQASATPSRRARACCPHAYRVVIWKSGSEYANTRRSDAARPTTSRRGVHGSRGGSAKCCEHMPAQVRSPEARHGAAPPQGLCPRKTAPSPRPSTVARHRVTHRGGGGSGAVGACERASTPTR